VFDFYFNVAGSNYNCIIRAKKYFYSAKTTFSIFFFGQISINFTSPKITVLFIHQFQKGGYYECQ